MTMPYDIQAIIFDFDGLIVETEMPSYLSWAELYQANGHQLLLSDWLQIVGGNNHAFNPLDELERLLSRPVDRASLMSEADRRQMDLVTLQAILPGVQEYVAGAKMLGLRLAVASSSRHNWVDGHLERLGLLGNFDAVVCRDDVKQVKPAPDLYLLALEKLGVAAEHAIAFEDSFNGMTAAQAAGIFCVVVPNDITRGSPFDAADLVVASLAELPLADVLGRATQRGSHVRD